LLDLKGRAFEDFFKFEILLFVDVDQTQLRRDEGQECSQSKCGRIQVQFKKRNESNLFNIYSIIFVCYNLAWNHPPKLFNDFLKVVFEAHLEIVLYFAQS
jgi:hypothetical protein